MKFEAYIHKNDTLQIKRSVPWQYGGGIDVSSPFVKKYLGEVEAESIKEARKKFIRQGLGEER